MVFRRAKLPRERQEKVEKSRSERSERSDRSQRSERSQDGGGAGGGDLRDGLVDPPFLSGFHVRLVFFVKLPFANMWFSPLFFFAEIEFRFYFPLFHSMGIYHYWRYGLMFSRVFSFLAKLLVFPWFVFRFWNRFHYT